MPMNYGDGRFIVSATSVAMKEKRDTIRKFLMQQTNCHRIGKVYSG